MWVYARYTYAPLNGMLKVKDIEKLKVSTYGIYKLMEKLEQQMKSYTNGIKIRR